MKLILLPGIDGTTELFQPLIDTTPDGINLDAISLGEATTYESMEQLVISRLDKNEPTVILGWSWSSTLTLRIAAQHPLGLVGIILCAGFASSPVRLGGKFLSLFSRPTLFRLFPLASRIKSILLNDSSDQLSELQKRAFNQFNPHVVSGRVRTSLRCDELTVLNQIDVPILSLIASRDLVIPRRHSRILEQNNPNVETIIIPGSHLFPATNSKECWNSIDPFLKRCCSNSE